MLCLRNSSAHSHELGGSVERAFSIPSALSFDGQTVAKDWKHEVHENRASGAQSHE